MDGVSAGSSVIAVASFAIQLADSIQKWVKFWRDVQDAPKDARKLFRDLETFAGLLDEVRGNPGSLCDDKSKRITERALQLCRERLEDLYQKATSASQKSGGKDRWKKKWADIKHVLNKEERAALKNDLEDAKSTLLLARQHDQTIILNSIHELLNNRPDIFLQVTQNTAFSKSENVNFNLVQFPEKMQFRNPLKDNPPIHNLHGSEDAMQTHASIGSLNPPPQRLGSTTTTTSTDASSPLILKKSSTLSLHHRRTLSTPLWVIHESSDFRKITRRNPTGLQPEEEKTIEYCIYPNSFLKTFGISRGFTIKANWMSGWKYTLTPFNSISSDAPIFAFCRDGNLGGVRTLFELGMGSVWDRDEKGRTPLWVASQFLQLEVADFLLRSGSDPDVCSFKSDISTFGAIQYSSEVNVERKIQMMSLFQSYCPDTHDDTQVMYMIGTLLRFYRPERLIPLTQTQKQAAALLIIQQLINHFTPSSIDRSKILMGLLQFSYNKRVLHWMIQNLHGWIDDSWIEGTMLHEAIVRNMLVEDRPGVELMVSKTKDLHKICGRRSLVIPWSTPCSLAMFRPGNWFVWVDILRKLNIDIEEFVREELSVLESPLTACGWTEETLSVLFQLEESLHFPEAPAPATGFYECERCGQKDFGSQTMINLPWRRHLRKLRNKTPFRTLTLDFTDESAPEPADSRVNIPEVRSSSLVLEKLPYDLVCAGVCRDGFSLNGAFEDNLGEMAFLPPYPYEEHAVEISHGEEGYPTNSIPGAFYD